MRRFAHFIFSIDLFILLASFAMSAPSIQATGRLRCLVQGCCHGRPADENIGICFTHPNSRVNKISGMAGVPLHPTQLYSCLLYTSDAADEEDSVDLGGLRIIKKKK